MVELGRMVEHYRQGTVPAYMDYVQRNAEEAVRRVRRKPPDGRFTYALHSGARIEVALSVD